MSDPLGHVETMGNTDRRNTTMTDTDGARLLWERLRTERNLRPALLEQLPPLRKTRRHQQAERLEQEHIRETGRALSWGDPFGNPYLISTVNPSRRRGEIESLAPEYQDLTLEARRARHVERLEAERDRQRRIAEVQATAAPSPEQWLVQHPNRKRPARWIRLPAAWSWAELVHAAELHRLGLDVHERGYVDYGGVAVEYVSALAEGFRAGPPWNGCVGAARAFVAIREGQLPALIAGSYAGLL